jgi:hypothetical protein
MIIVLCIALVVISILFLAGWFFYSIEIAQRRIDNDSE